MSECVNNKHFMGVVHHPTGVTFSVWNDEDFAEDKDMDGFIKFHFCPNCGKELKEFYEEDK